MGIFDWLFGKKPQDDQYQRGPLTSRLPRGRFGQDRHKPSGNWVQTTTVVQVAGVQHRRNAAEAFCMAVHSSEQSRRPYGVLLRPDPGNAHDPNAIAVHGFAEGKTWHVGFLDRDTASAITRDLLANSVAIDAELYAIWIADDGYIEIKLIVLAPPGHSMKKRLRSQRVGRNHEDHLAR